MAAHNGTQLQFCDAYLFSRGWQFCRCCWRCCCIMLLAPLCCTLRHVDKQTGCRTAAQGTAVQKERESQEQHNLLQAAQALLL
jgi:hypothetical protein